MKSWKEHRLISLNHRKRPVNATYKDSILESICAEILHASLRAPPNLSLRWNSPPGLWGLHPGYLAVGKLLDDALLSGDGYIGITHTSSTYPMCLFYHVRIIGLAGGQLFIVRHQFGWMVKEHPNELNRMNLENFLLDNVTTVLMARMVGKNQIFAENCNETAMIDIPL